MIVKAVAVPSIVDLTSEVSSDWDTSTKKTKIDNLKNNRYFKSYLLIVII